MMGSGSSKKWERTHLALGVICKLLHCIVALWNYKFISATIQYVFIKSHHDMMIIVLKKLLLVFPS